MSAVARVAALKKVDFPVFGLPITPSNREYDLCMGLFSPLGYCVLCFSYIICV
jgi:hypothetical protein